MSTLISLSCSIKGQSHLDFTSYSRPANSNLWLKYSKKQSEFKLWSPYAQKIKLRLYKKGHEGKPTTNYEMSPSKNGVWIKILNGDLNGTYYTYSVKINNKWLDETPGIYAKAVGVNGKRAMVLNFENTNPEGWELDKGPKITYPSEAIIYELHVRDFTIHPESGSAYPGKYLGLVEANTFSKENTKTGIEHLKNLGITHVHMLPAFDYNSVDEANLHVPQYNWGYAPQNYNVPEGSYSSNPHDAEVRIKEFKQMIKSFHDHGIGVILDVVYNHTALTEKSNFNLEVPNYFFRQKEDGTPSDASACGNEVASERAMTRKFIVESVSYWVKEYHIDGFRFDLMGILDIDTMNEVTDVLKRINPNIVIYGEGWLAGDSPLTAEDRATKQNIRMMPIVSAFGDELRDGLKGSVFESESTGFVSGSKNAIESIKFGVVGGIKHPGINYAKVNYSNTFWAQEPWQHVSYVSCHDNNTLFDKLKLSKPEANEVDIIAMHKLAHAIVMTSQGVPFLHSGSEMLRTKYFEENSYNLPDSINQIDWTRKSTYSDVNEYFKNLIKLRKNHPAFRMNNSKDVVTNLHFKKSISGLLSYTINNLANGDSWKKILVIYNASEKSINYKLQEVWKLAVIKDSFDLDGNNLIEGNVKTPPISMLIAFQE